MTKNHHPENHPRPRIVHRNGKIARIKRRGIKKFLRNDLYINSLRLSWWYLILTIGFFYVLINLIFAGLYLIQDGGVKNLQPGSFSDAFFFSVQTLATIGYGTMSPVTIFANILVTIEALIGLGSLAIVAGIIFSRIFSFIFDNGSFCVLVQLYLTLAFLLSLKKPFCCSYIF